MQINVNIDAIQMDSGLEITQSELLAYLQKRVSEAFPDVKSRPFRSVPIRQSQLQLEGDSRAEILESFAQAIIHKIKEGDPRW